MAGPSVSIRSRVLFRCSVPQCRVEYSWVGPFRLATEEKARADDQALATSMAAELGWTFPAPGNRCPRHREEP